MEGFETWWALLLPSRFFDWNRKPNPAHRGTPLPVARWIRTLPSRRRASNEAHAKSRRPARRPVEDNSGAEPTFHDHLDRSERPIILILYWNWYSTSPRRALLRSWLPNLY